MSSVNEVKILLKGLLVLLCTGCSVEVDFDKSCVPSLIYTIDKNYMRYANLGTLEKPEIIAIVDHNNWENSFTTVMHNNVGISARTPVRYKVGTELKLLGPTIFYVSHGPTPSKILLYVNIDDRSTWISIGDLYDIAADQPYEINRENNTLLSIPYLRTLEVYNKWRDTKWSCPNKKDRGGGGNVIKQTTADLY